MGIHNRCEVINSTMEIQDSSEVIRQTDIQQTGEVISQTAE
jgi:hypothetical protein